MKRFFDYFEEALAAIILAFMAILTFLNVITRYVITYPLAFTEELTVSLFVWIVLLGSAIAFKKNSNLAMTFLYDRMPLRAQRFCFCLSTLLSVIFFALLFWLGAGQVLEEIELGVTTDSLAISAACYSIAIPVFSLLIIVRILQAARKIFADMKDRGLQNG